MRDDDAPPAWRTCLDVERQDAGHYLGYVNEGLLRLVDRAPARVLELGCAGGVFGARIKLAHPGATVVGIEASRAAAEEAARRLDHVVHARLEDVAFGTDSPAGGRFDLAIVADVLEHLVNPWELLLRLKACLAPGAALLASIPNVRNLGLAAEVLDQGRWEYRERGLLDVTHLRFFAFDDMREMFRQTGYAVEAMGVNLSPSLAGIYQAHRGTGPVTLRLGRLALENVSQRELTELCAEQFLLRCRAA
jgi:SAM-dependent methyltransferase